MPNSVIPNHPRNAARMKTRMGCCASTFPNTPTCPFDTPQHLTDVATNLNNRLLRNLSDDTPAERFVRVLSIHE